MIVPVSETPMKPYSRPVLRDLGRMDSVTRKSGPDNDPGAELWTYGEWDTLCDGPFAPWLPWCNGASGNSPTGPSGSSSF